MVLEAATEGDVEADVVVNASPPPAFIDLSRFRASNPRWSDAPNDSWRSRRWNRSCETIAVISGEEPAGEMCARDVGGMLAGH